MRPLETRYAQALFELVQDEEALNRDVELLTGTPELWKALLNPSVSQREKDRVLCRLFQGQSRKELLDFYRLLCRRDRMALLPAIREEYHKLSLKRENGAIALFRCARRPSQEDLERIGQALKKRHGLSRLEFQIQEEPELLGGFVIHLEGVTYDKSVRGMLQGLRRSLKERE